MLVFLYFPYKIYCVLEKNKMELRHDKDREAIYGELFFEVKVPTPHLNHTSIYFYCVFLLRRMVFVLIPLVFFKNSGLQLTLLIVVIMVYSVWVCHYRPLEGSIQKIKVFNEFSLLLLSYNMIIFTTTQYHPV